MITSGWSKQFFGLDKDEAGEPTVNLTILARNVIAAVVGFLGTAYGLHLKMIYDAKEAIEKGDDK